MKFNLASPVGSLLVCLALATAGQACLEHLYASKGVPQCTGVDRRFTEFCCSNAGGKMFLNTCTIQSPDMKREWRNCINRSPLLLSCRTDLGDTQLCWDRPYLPMFLFSPSAVMRSLVVLNYTFLCTFFWVGRWLGTVHSLEDRMDLSRFRLHILCRWAWYHSSARPISELWICHRNFLCFVTDLKG